MVHLGLGNFFRAHQAWYTHHANQGLPLDEQWGIVAFSGRSTDVVDAMRAQDGLYTLLVDGRGWTPERYGRHLADAWRRMFLDKPEADPPC